MKYGLYENTKYTPIVEKGIEQAIFNFTNALKSLSKDFKGTGITDTAAKETIAEAVTDAIFEKL